MERRTIYLDLDDTVFNTSYFLEQATGWVVEYPKTIYDVFAETSDFFNMSAMLEYSKIPLNISVEDIKSLEEKYKVVVCTEYYTVTEIERKVSIMRDIFQINAVKRENAKKSTFFKTRAFLWPFSVVISRRRSFFFWFIKIYRS